MVKTPCFHCERRGFSPWLGKFHVLRGKMHCGQKQNKNKKRSVIQMAEGREPGFTWREKGPPSAAPYCSVMSDSL